MIEQTTFDSAGARAGHENKDLTADTGPLVNVNLDVDNIGTPTILAPTV